MTAELRIERGPVVIVQTPDDPGDYGEPRQIDADGETVVFVPTYDYWPTATRVPESGWSPPIAMFMALAEVLHGNDDVCNAAYYMPFGQCATREHDIEQAIAVLVDLHRNGWRLVRDPGDTAELGL